MTRDANPCEDSCAEERPSKQTFEYRVADGSANPYLIVAGLVVAALRGIEMPAALEMAEQLYVSGNIFRPEFRERLATFRQLPASCVESAEALEAKRAIFEADGIFPTGMIESRIASLKAFDDRGLSERLYGNNEAIRELVEEYLHIA
ncbi:Glutamine synthetase, catalytic domain [anaerobic digester metagenome]